MAWGARNSISTQGVAGGVGPAGAPRLLAEEAPDGVDSESGVVFDR